PETRAERLKVIEALFPNLPDLGPDPLVDGQPGDKRTTHAELTDYALRNNPTIVQARAEIENQRGQWVQAVLYTNPTFGLQADQLLDGRPYGQVGGVRGVGPPGGGRPDPQQPVRRPPAVHVGVEAAGGDAQRPGHAAGPAGRAGGRGHPPLPLRRAAGAAVRGPHRHPDRPQPGRPGGADAGAGAPPG